MKREIKFRGKRNNGKWAYGSLVYSQNIQPAIYFEVGKGAARSFDWCYISPDTIGQFTGLYDKNGKEIYEGDLLSIGEYRYVCEFVEGGFEFRDKRDNLLIVKSIVHHTEVIGNIHVNKDLL